MRRLALPSAVVRSSKLGCAALANGTLSISSDAHAAADQRRGEAGADHAAADDGDVDRGSGRGGGGGHDRAPQPRAISASICVGILGRTRR